MADFAGNNAQVHSETRPSAGSPLELDDRQFANWTRLLEQRLGLFIAPERRSFLVSGIRARARETGCSSCQEYYEQMIAGGAAQAREWTLLTDRLTVHETCFFRHEASMHLVSDLLIPEAFERHQGLLAWSVACSTGEEAYSLAMLLDDAAEEWPGEIHYGVTGTDISLPALQHAREGVYLKRRLNDIPAAYQRRYCRSVSNSRFQVDDRLRQRVCFSQVNLRDIEAAPMRKVDLIYCQNLLIYYGRKQREEIVNGLVEFLRPGGVLILGPGELLEWQYPNMEKVRYDDTAAYRRTD